MAEHLEPGATSPASTPVGSVAEETARLLDALLGEVSPSGAPAPPGPTDAPDEASYGAVPHDAWSSRVPGAETCARCGAPPGADQGPSAAGPPPSVCHLCPVCQLLRVARAVRPETVDRLADLAGALTDLLREVAAARHGEPPAPGAHGPDGPPTRPAARGAGTEVEDIPVDADDALDADDLDEPDDPVGSPDTPPEESRP